MMKPSMGAMGFRIDQAEKFIVPSSPLVRRGRQRLDRLYPVAIVLIVLSFLPAQFQKRPAYVGCVALTAAQSVLAALPLTTVFANALPLGQFGFGWVVPALVGLGIGVFCR